MSRASATAELIPDHGAAASSREDFFRSALFLEVEGVTHTLRIESREGELLAPLIVRPIEAGPLHDGASPYGYPGLAGPNRLLFDPSTIDFAPTGLVSLFIRHQLGDPPLARARERATVQIADPTLSPKTRMSDRQQTRRNVRRGYQLRIVPGPATNAQDRAGFLAVYEQTMRRTAATRRYFFGADYFERILCFERSWLALALAPGGEVAAGSVAVASDHVLHYFLSGSADAYLRDSPMKNVLFDLIELSVELGMPLNLGGGIRRGDQLEEFKRGFANREQSWFTSEIVCDPIAYRQLSDSSARAGGFFPAYRAR